MKREYHKWHSQFLDRDMELLVFGSGRERVIVFPTRDGRFYDYENWGMVTAAGERIESGQIQLFCVDSVDREALYADWATPRDRLRRHREYEDYVLSEVLPFSGEQNDHASCVAHGCSLGAYHAANFALRHPDRFNRVVALSGRYDVTLQTGSFRDLFDGYYDEDVYFHNPSHFIPGMWDEELLGRLRRLNIVLGIGREDAFFENNVQFSHALQSKGIPHRLEVYDGEAHRPRYWRDMIRTFL